MSTFTTRREERIHELLDDPNIQVGELAQELCEFVEAEVRAAFIRGLSKGREGGGDSRGSNQSRGYRSALQQGKLRPKQHDRGEGS